MKGEAKTKREQQRVPSIQNSIDSYFTPGPKRSQRVYPRPVLSQFESPPQKRHEPPTGPSTRSRTRRGQIDTINSGSPFTARPPPQRCVSDNDSDDDENVEPRPTKRARLSSAVRTPRSITTGEFYLYVLAPSVSLMHCLLQLGRTVPPRMPP